MLRCPSDFCVLLRLGRRRTSKVGRLTFLHTVSTTFPGSLLSKVCAQRRGLRHPAFREGACRRTVLLSILQCTSNRSSLLLSLTVVSKRRKESCRWLGLLFTLWSVWRILRSHSCLVFILYRPNGLYYVLVLTPTTRRVPSISSFRFPKVRWRLRSQCGSTSLFHNLSFLKAKVIRIFRRWVVCRVPLLEVSRILLRSRKGRCLFWYP